MKTYPPYIFDGKNISCYTIKLPIREEFLTYHLLMRTDDYKKSLEQWQQSKITVPVDEVCIEELDNYLMLNIIGKSFNLNKISYADYLKTNPVDISELSDRIVIEEIEKQIKYTNGEYSRSSQFVLEAKLLSL